MSFGWSASDIATAISVTYKLIQALDDAHGAADNYREAVAFLEDLLRVLKPLETLTLLNAYPTYGNEITRQLDKINRPVESFLAAVLKYEPSLGGDKASKGWRKTLQTTIRKLDWYMFMENKVLSLKKKIESHMRVLDTLLQRLTLDVVSKAQEELPATLISTFQETIQPALLVALRECVTSQLDTNHATVMAMFSKHLQLSESIKQKSDRPETTQQQIKDALPRRTRIDEQTAHPEITQPTDLRNVIRARSFQEVSCQQEIPPDLESEEESLSEVCYFIMLYMLLFLKGATFALSRLVKPSKALTFQLSPKQNITFLDAIGRQPIVLQYEVFQSFKMLQTFIEQEFKTLPGSSFVARGRYILLNIGNNRSVDEDNWKQMILPGAKIAMAIIISKRPQVLSGTSEEMCPESKCSGTWKRSETGSWVTCPLCHREITEIYMFAKERRRIQESLKHSNNETTEHDEFETESDSEEKQISSFKRIARSAQPIGKSKTIEPAEREKIARQKQTRHSIDGYVHRFRELVEHEARNGAFAIGDPIPEIYLRALQKVLTSVDVLN